MHRHLPLTLAVALLASATSAEAFTLDPISRIFDTSGSKATQTFVITNPSSKPIAVEVSIATLERDLDYRETNRPADDEFLIYPPQIIVKPGARQTVRVQWLGDPDPASEKTFRIIAEQLPIDLASPGQSAPTEPVGQVRVLITYRGTLYIRPRGAKPIIGLAEAKPASDPSGEQQLSLTLRNRGKAHAVISSCRGSIASTQGDARVALDSAALQGLANSKILAGDSRRFHLPWPKGLPFAAVDASVRCKLKQ